MEEEKEGKGLEEEEIGPSGQLRGKGWRQGPFGRFSLSLSLSLSLLPSRRVGERELIRGVVETRSLRSSSSLQRAKYARRRVDDIGQQAVLSPLSNVHKNMPVCIFPYDVALKYEPTYLDVRNRLNMR